MISSKQALRKIINFYDKSTFKQHDDDVEWYVDEETEIYYSCKFKLYDRKFELRCNKMTGVIEVL